MIKKIAFSKYKFGDFIEGWQGEINVSTKKEFFTEINKKYHLPLVRGNNIGIYCMVSKPKEYCPRNVSKRSHHSIRRIVIQEVSNAGLLKRIKGCILKDVLCGHTTNYIIPKIKKYNLFFY